MHKCFAIVSDAFHFALTLSPLKLYNYVLIRSSYYLSILFRKPFHRGMPFSISVEPTTSCNLRCPECPSGLREFTRPQGSMSEVDFQNVIDQLKGQLMYLMLYFQGEPILNPDFFQMIEFARKKRIYTATSTNAHFLNDDNAKKLIESGLNRLIISMDGTDQGTYEKYRKEGELDKVKEGILNILKWKKELRSSRPYLIIQFLVFKHNEHQIPEIKKFAKGLGIRLELKTAQVYNFRNDTELIPNNLRYSRYSRGSDGKWDLRKRGRNHCFRMWSGAVVTWDGRVVPCCFDKDASHQLGRLDNHFFKEVWKSKDYEEFRRQILEDRSRIDICKNCTE